MDQFSISQLSQFSGIKSHTIRIWEQRYNALQPHRSEGNTRYYDGSQLRRLLNIVSLSGTGKKVSQLCTLSDEELFQLRKEYEGSAGLSNDYEYFINQLIAGGMSYDEINFDKTFSHCLLRFGLQKTYVEIIYPLLNRIGLMWSTNNIPPSQEHYISNLLRQKMFTAIDAMPPGVEGEEKWLLFLPEDEFHELGLLFANYFLRSKGKHVVYLGPNVPLSSVRHTLEDISVHNLLLFMVHRYDANDVAAYINELLELTPGKKIYIAGNGITNEEISSKDSFVKLSSVEELESHLTPLKQS
ncbi:MerR family transcriptional regulator [Salinimicrobium oceani]|uniref:MerR family transcriptional regulator n=1 Tax=Salinimicrobium oceani TaxID=2722702 RepID=A0ABX1D0H2_9FLAO|nr:MerR family transcriptional regulator [Salinimicrobium oceani]NJW52832.1 MerR family transcriptional regulator [Salinimicrobium oceani]